MRQYVGVKSFCIDMFDGPLVAVPVEAQKRNTELG